MKRDTLLIVDDVEVNRAILRGLFESEYNILEADNGEQALMMIRQYKDTLTAVLLDIVMPVKSGYDVMKEMRHDGLLEIIPAIVITSRDSSEDEMRTFDLGASDIIMKPFEPAVVRRRVENVIELHQHKMHLEELVEEQAVSLRESQNVLMDALSSVIEYRSLESGQHVLRIRMFTKILLEDAMKSYPEYGLDRHKIQVISAASALHDIGKIAIPDAILNKPGKLTREEFEVMKTHAEKGSEILISISRMHDKEYLRYAYNICRYHHERWDGRGYPEGLKEENIPICAQAVGIADAYDALTTDRVYKKAYSPEKAFTMILNGECGQFSPRLLESFKNVQQEFATLTMEYADGLSPKAAFQENAEELSSRPAREGGNTMELGQMKYFAMLRYEDSTVVEADTDTGIYHVVYKQNQDFDVLCAGSGLLDESYRTFMESSIHPEDWRDAPISESLRDFLTSGAMKKTQRHRVLHRATGAYVWYEMTTLRINTEDPRQHKVLIVWREAAHRQPKEAAGTCAITTGNSQVCLIQCRNDRHFTIVRVNDGFVSLLGYSREELASRFNGRFIEMIYGKDRAATLKQFFSEANEGDTTESEYRVETRDGRLLWLLDKSQKFMGEDGVEYIDCVLMDITKTKQEQEELRLSMERHQIIMDQTNDIVFEWDIRANTISYSSNWIKMFGYHPISEDISLRIPKASHIMPEDMPVFTKLMDDILASAPYGEAEIRIADKNGRYIWCRIRATTQFNSAKEPIKAVGVIIDIDQEKRMTRDLMDKADHDSLTGLYNKGAARRRIERLMEQARGGTDSAIMILDLDNFKRINDVYGHMFGDAVLMEVSTRLKDLARAEDVIARIGGDEFLVYLHDVPCEETLLERARQTVESVLSISPEELRGNPLTCTVGVAWFPRDGGDYQELFRSCDQALYQAKAQGKNQFLVYDRESMKHHFGMEQWQAAAASTRIDSDSAYDFDAIGLMQQTFQILYQMKDIKQGVQSILEMVGRRYQVSRVYIFEESKDGKSFSNTFEWCREGVTATIDRLQNLGYAEIGDYKKNFDANGVFYCTDVRSLPQPQRKLLEEQGIDSMLQCAIYDGGKFVGFVGFDNCVGKRIWTQSQINTLSFVSELMSIFLLKNQAQNDLAEANRDLRTLLDTQNSWIYVIDPETYELRYINERTCRLVPEAKNGMCCYKAFFNQEQPCEICPAREIRKEVSRTLEVYNPMLGLWTQADASLIRWAGEDACLLVCHNITAYKNAAGEGAFENEKKQEKETCR